MKAIILAAGMGTRLMPKTKDVPKCLVKLHGRPLLEYQLEAFRRVGISSPAIVTGYKEEALRPYGLTHYRNDRFETTNMVHSLFCAEREFNDDVIVSYGDIIFEPRVLRALVESREKIAVVVDTGWRELWQLRMANPLDDAETLRLEKNGRIREIGKKATSYDQIQGQYIGLFKISRSAWPEVASFYRGMDPKGTYDGKPYEKMFMTSFLHLMTNGSLPIHAVPVEHGWVEVDTVADLERYEAFGEKEKRFFDFSSFG